MITLCPGSDFWSLVPSTKVLHTSTTACKRTTFCTNQICGRIDAHRMDFPYSPSRDPSGGSFHLSPTHLHHVDTVAAIRKLRRTLSRSPSKRPQSKFTQARSCSVSPSSQLSPIQIASPLSKVSNLSHSADDHYLDDTIPPSAKKFRPTLRRTTPLRSLRQSRTQSNSPMRRALSDSSDQGNASPQSSKNPREGQENQSSPEGSPTEPFTAELKANDAHLRMDGISITLNLPPARFDRGGRNTRDWPQFKSSPLKRSDGVMNLDTADLGSPSAKRRSFCSSVGSFEIARDDRDDSDLDLDLDDAPDSELESSSNDVAFRSPLAPRFAASRKSIPHHRACDKPTTARFRRSIDFGLDTLSTGKLNARSRPRTSLDSALPSSARNGHDLPGEPLGHGSHLAEIPRIQYARPMRQHPLSQALSPTSPTPTRTEEGSNNCASFFRSPVRPTISFSKSLPIGALRPRARESHMLRISQASSGEPTLSTPEIHKIARPDPAAFRSTGLISKRHRNAEDLPPPILHPGMPDTPCKRVPPGFTIEPSPTSTKSIAKPRFTQPAFGTPSRPFNPHSSRPTPESLGKSVSIFGSNYQYGNPNRRGSFISNDGKEDMQATWTDRKSIKQRRTSSHSDETSVDHS